MAGLLFVAASVAINYQVKFVMHQTGNGAVQKLGAISVGQPAPDFTLEDLSGHPVTLSSYRNQKVVLMDFWATWCGPCRMEMPDLQAMGEKFKDVSFEILSLNQGESADQVRDFLQRRKYTFHALLDSDNAVGNQFGVQAIPTLILVDKKGVVRFIRVGYAENEDDLWKLVTRLTKE